MTKQKTSRMRNLLSRLGRGSRKPRETEPPGLTERTLPEHAPAERDPNKGAQSYTRAGVRASKARYLDIPAPSTSEAKNIPAPPDKPWSGSTPDDHGRPISPRRPRR